MSEDINKTILVGRLTRDSELQYTNSGYALCKFSVAVNRRKKQGDQWIDEANFFDINLWGKRGESLSQYLKKGSQVAIEGQLKQDRWEQDGVKRSKVSIDAINIQLLGSKQEGGGNNQPGRQSQPQGQYNQQQGNSLAPEFQQNGNPERLGNSQGFKSYTPPSQPVKDDYEDDIPF